MSERKRTLAEVVDWISGRLFMVLWWTFGFHKRRWTSR